MEKLLEFKKGKVWDENSKMYRFQCDCLTASHAIDVNVESYGKDDEQKYISVYMDFINDGFFDRLKHAWQVFMMKWAWREFYFRAEDYKNISEIFDPNKKFSELP